MSIWSTTESCARPGQNISPAEKPIFLETNYPVLIAVCFTALQLSVTSIELILRRSGTNSKTFRKSHGSGLILVQLTPWCAKAKLLFLLLNSKALAKSSRLNCLWLKWLKLLKTWAEQFYDLLHWRVPLCRFYVILILWYLWKAIHVENKLEKMKKLDSKIRNNSNTRIRKNWCRSRVIWRKNGRGFWLEWLPSITFINWTPKNCVTTVLVG